MASQTSMNETGPEAMAPVLRERDPLWTDRREIVADTTAALHRHRAFFQRTKDARDRILDRAHDKAVEQGHVAIRAGTGLDAAARHKLEVLQNIEETLLPRVAIGLLCLSKRVSDAPPGCLHGRFGHTGAVACLPHMTRDWCAERVVSSHRGTPKWPERWIRWRQVLSTAASQHRRARGRAAPCWR